MSDMRAKLVRLGQTRNGRIILVVLAIWALVVLGDSAMRVGGMGVYARSYSGTVVSKHVSTWGTIVQIASGRSLFRPTERRGFRTPTVGPWRVVIRNDGETREVAVPRSVYERARPGAHMRKRTGQKVPVLSDETDDS